MRQRLRREGDLGLYTGVFAVLVVLVYHYSVKNFRYLPIALIASFLTIPIGWALLTVLRDQLVLWQKNRKRSGAEVSALRLSNWLAHDSGRLLGSWILAACLALITVIIGPKTALVSAAALTLAVGLTDMIQTHRFLASATRVKGRIARVTDDDETLPGDATARTLRSSKLVVRFIVNGEPVRVPWQPLLSKKMGARIIVFYLDDDPHEVRFGKPFTYLRAFTWVGLGMLLLFFRAGM